MSAPVCERFGWGVPVGRSLRNVHWFADTPESSAVARRRFLTFEQKPSEKVPLTFWLARCRWEWCYARHIGGRILNVYRRATAAPACDEGG